MRNLVILSSILALAGAQLLGRHQQIAQGKSVNELAPSPRAARLLSLGYRELCADLFYTRGLALQGGRGETLAGVTAVGNAAVACDPYYVPVYEWLPTAAEYADEFDALQTGAPQIAFQTAVDFLERGLEVMPNEWRLLVLAGQIYATDLKSKDPAQKQAWNERGALLLERAVRQPNAPKHLATLAAHLRSNLGQRERARENLMEMMAVATTFEERQKYADKLAKLDAKPADSLIYEFELRKSQAEQQWLAERPSVSFADSLLLATAPTVDLNPAQYLNLSKGMVLRDAPSLPPLYEDVEAAQ